MFASVPMRLDQDYYFLRVKGEWRNNKKKKLIIIINNKKYFNRMIQAAVVIEVEHNGSNRVLESTKPRLCIVTHNSAI